MGTFKLKRKTSAGLEEIKIPYSAIADPPSNIVTTDGAQTIKGSKTFSSANTFTAETMFTHSTYAPKFTDIALGIGKSSCFTRGAFMQAIAGQILAPNTSYTEAGKGYSVEANKIKFQKMVASNGQPTVTDMAVISESGMSLGTKTVATTDQIPDINQKTNTTVVPNDNGEIKTRFRMAQKGYTSGATWYYPLFKFPANNAGNYASAILSGRIGGWESGNMSYINALLWNRGTPSISLIDIAGTATSMSSIWNTADLVLYVNSDATATVYVKCVNYYTFDLDLELYQGAAAILYDDTYLTSTPSGTLTAQASTSSKRLELVNGTLLAGGQKLVKASNFALSGTTLTISL